MVDTPDAPPSPEPANLDTETLSSSPFGQVPIEISIIVGHAHPLVSDLMGLRANSVLPLDRRIDDPVELTIAGQVIARGLLKELDGDSDGQLAVCLTEVNDLKTGL